MGTMERRRADNYELLIFDADGTIFDYERAEVWAFEKMCQDFSLPDTPNLLETYRVINSAIWKEFEAGTIDAAGLKVERFARLADTSGLDLDPAAVSEDYLERLSETGFLLEGTHEVLTQLRERYRLALLTNGITHTQEGRLERSDTGKYFDPIVISEQTGLQKPDPRIFGYLFERAGFTDKDRALMIGDSLSSDIAGARAFGIDSCYLNQKQIASDAPTFEITSLYDLLDILL